MSEQELVKAYADGMISRRIFIRGLVAGGLSAGAALAFASSISKRTGWPVLRHIAQPTCRSS